MQSFWRKQMKEIIVKNYRDIPAQVQTQGNNQFSVKPVIEDIAKCSANFVEVEPGKYAYGYHYHEENEEIFYIISGEASVKTEKGDIHLNTGDIICFPADISGSHVISNLSKTEKLVYLDFGTANRPDVVHFTGTTAGMVITRKGIYNFSK